MLHLLFSTVIHSAKFYLKMGILLLMIMMIAIAGLFKTFWSMVTNRFHLAQRKCFFIQGLFRISLLMEEQLIVRIFAAFCSIFFIYIMGTLGTVGIKENLLRPSFLNQFWLQLECDPDEFELIMIEADVANKPFHFICFDPWVSDL